MEYVILLISLAGIVFGADFLVAGAVSIAKKFKVPDCRKRLATDCATSFLQ